MIELDYRDDQPVVSDLPLPLFFSESLPSFTAGSISMLLLIEL